MKKCFLSFLFVFALLVSGDSYGQSTENSSAKNDSHSFAHPEKAVVKHLDLLLNVDFAIKQLSGKAVWTIDNISKGDEIIFDDNGLNIEKITLGDAEVETNYSLSPRDSLLGNALHVKIFSETKKICIYYTTASNAIALQWLTAAQTTDKKQPYLFTQSYSIWARSWIPCQDSPGIRFTYDATITVPEELMAAMSAEGPKAKQENGIYHFKQTHPIPAYLTALVVGDIQFKAIDSRTGVYAEPSLIDKAAWEFADMGKVVNATESLYGPYRWGRFDVLVAPPSFTLSGMENPNLVFLNTGLLTGDHSLVWIVTHELAHNWSGNLVTNATWNDFWLNEGVTSYVTNRIEEILYGKEEANMEAINSRTKLKNEITAMGADNPDTHLYLDLKGRNPDDALTAIPYEKGFAFLQMIEKTVGRQKFDAFLKNYFNDHKFQSHTTEQFLSALQSELIKNDSILDKSLQIDNWVYGGGIPNNAIIETSSSFGSIDALLVDIKSTGDYTGMAQKITSSIEQTYLLNHLPSNLLPEEMLKIDTEFHFTDSKNYILARAWFLLSIKYHYNEKSPQLENFMLKYGSVSQTLYQELSKTPEGKNWAKQIFEKAKSGYHPLTTARIEDILNK
ncbi:MAG: leukotriene A4 hydrolase C-terminal domain-containing protein [Aquaticitalea sp.]